MSKSSDSSSNYSAKQIIIVSYCGLSQKSGFENNKTMISIRNITLNRCDFTFQSQLLSYIESNAVEKVIFLLILFSSRCQYCLKRKRLPKDGYHKIRVGEDELLDILCDTCFQDMRTFFQLYYFVINVCSAKTKRKMSITVFTVESRINYLRKVKFESRGRNGDRI